MVAKSKPACGGAPISPAPAESYWGVCGQSRDQKSQPKLPHQWRPQATSSTQRRYQKERKNQISMRDSNYRSITNNRAAVTITTSLYDRRALDVTADKPLVNSLNHLTYLVSSSAKVRETLSNDGGIERLVEILHECHNTTFNAQDNIFNSEKKLLTAWKWTLAFQCLVLIGTGGTEKIRLKVVAAGMLPIIATVLDNYMSLHEGSLVPAGATPPVCPYMHPNAQNGQYMNFGEGGTRHPDFVRREELRSRQDLGELRPRQELADINTPTASAVASAGNAAAAANALQNMELGENTMSQPQLPYEPRMTQADAMARMGGLHINSLTCEDYENLTVDQMLRLVRCTNSLPSLNGQDAVLGGRGSAVNNDIRRRFLIVTILKKIKEEKEQECPEPSYREPIEYEMDCNLQFLSDLYLQDERSTHITNMIHAKSAPRNFTETGVVIPRDDDVVWCLQLLAYISKYPYLKETLQNTHTVIDMSIRDKKHKSFSGDRMKANISSSSTNGGKDLSANAREALLARKGRILSSHGHDNNENFLERFNASPSNLPQMLSDLNLRDDNFNLNDDVLDLYDKPNDRLTEDAEANDLDDDGDSEDSDHRNKDDDGDVNEYLLSFEDNVTMSNHDLSSLSKLYDQIIDAESIVNDLDREIALYQISEKVNKHIESECQALSDTIVKKRAEEVEYLSEKWNYETYAYFDIDDDGDNIHGDYDMSLIEHKRVNLFPMVEKFTFLAGTDMYYWSGVIMRNSCRRNDLKGGVRQCGNLECGKWESYPREFSKCKKCKRTKYCSRECQMRAWHCHKNWCVPSASSTSTSTQAAGNRTNTEGREEVSSPHHNDNEQRSRGGGATITVRRIGSTDADGMTLNTDGMPHNSASE